MLRKFAILGLSVLTLAATQTHVWAAAFVPDWTGFYVGLSAGGRFAENNWATTDVAPTLASTLTTDPNSSASFDSAAARFGGYFGYNWSIAPRWIAGLEAGAGWADNSKSRTPVPGTIQSDTALNITYINQPSGTVKETWDASLRGRIGRLITPDTLVFAAGGAALQQVKLSAACPTSGGTTDWCTIPHDESATSTRLGWTAGAGIERMVGRWIVRLEYRYADFGTFSHTFFTYNTTTPYDDRFTAHVDMRTQTISLGVAYKLGDPAPSASH